MDNIEVREPYVPDAPRAIQKGTPLTSLLDIEAIECLAKNIFYVHREFEVKAFCEFAKDGLEPLSLMQRGQHIAKALRRFLPDNYSDAVAVLVASFTPVKIDAEEFGLAAFFYLPHGAFIAEYGQNPEYNHGVDPFDTSMKALYELTTRFTSEFAIRPFLIDQQERTLATLASWLVDSNPHVRRLCSEGTRPKLPWGKRLAAFVTDPTPTLFILEALRNDESLYVRRSVANHLGDIAKDHPDTVFSLCESWLEEGASKEVKWLIRHAVRHPAKKKDERALAIRVQAK
ncbi:DNA alkylation repair protein [Marinomonas sp. C2222]|uniref:DNA alkylation repair protein n=1 Tax=Marinomonas sargassi TaxID=2984494 RepID=A0ABT2YWZ7_9GAMM|nr:DNA alkylation repair protein [Marinomonas sargassi]MCV2404084.1 DNA alkylation repair protein [Marinomonas sargassi]